MFVWKKMIEKNENEIKIYLISFLIEKKKMNWMKIENYHYCLYGSWMKKNKNESFMTTFLLCIYGGREITSTLVHWCDWVAFGQKHLDSWMVLDEE